jgi:hypothetical protein
MKAQVSLRCFLYKASKSSLFSETLRTNEISEKTRNSVSRYACMVSGGIKEELIKLKLCVEGF